MLDSEPPGKFKITFESTACGYNSNVSNMIVDDDALNGLVVHTINEMLVLGLKHVGYSEQRIQKSSPESNKYLRVHFGSDAKAVCQIWMDLQTTIISEAFVPKTKRNVKHYLMALHMLKLYPTEVQRESIFDISPSYGREWCWYFIEKIRALKASKIVWEDVGEEIWIMTIDGIHVWTNEYIHPVWSKDSKQFSHKYNHAGMSYELGISLSKNQVMWMNGPFKAGANDKKGHLRY